MGSTISCGLISGVGQAEVRAIECGFSNTTAISRLLNACNPETIASGSTCGNTGPWGAVYTYDADSNVVTKKDGRGITLNYSYDALNRLLGKTYTVPSPAPIDYAATPAVTYTYDPDPLQRFNDPEWRRPPDRHDGRPPEGVRGPMTRWAACKRL